LAHTLVVLLTQVAVGVAAGRDHLVDASA